MNTRLFFMFIFGFTISFVKANAQFYISSTGNDNNPGTKEQPLATLTGARDAVRKFKHERKLTAPITVIIKGGTYPMTAPLVLLPEDGGTEQNPVIYKAEEGTTPIFSGGKKITGFKVNQNGVWETLIPESAYYKWRFDQLYVNGKRAVMARTPNTGFLEIEKVNETVWEKGNGRISEKAQQVISFDKNNFKSIFQIQDNELQNVRFRAYHKWDFTLRFIDKIEKDSLRISTSGRGMKPWNRLVEGGRIVFENYAAALDTTGEWFLNDRGTLFYKPQPGETPENSEVIAPALDQFLSIKGNATENNFVENIRFEGITFSYCHHGMPKLGFEPNQAAVSVGAAIMLEGARNITFSNCEISKTGQHALWFGKGCSNSLVDHCYLNNLGGGGIYLGDPAPLQGEEHTSNIRLINNIIQSGGKEFPSAVGIWVGNSSDNEISHNDIGNFYYTGISAGWVWGYGDSKAIRNKITFNHIHHIGWALLSDMAAIYTLGKSEETVISNNVIDHIHAYSYGGWGLYTDEGSSGILMENNLVYKTKTGGFHQHYGANNTLRNNIFVFAKLYQIQCTRVEKHRSFTFQNNIVLFDEGVVLNGPWDKIDIQMDKNLYWNIAGGKYYFNGKSFADWQKSGHDKKSIIADPGFRNPLNFDFSLMKKNNTRKIGFVPFDYTRAGVFGEKTWTDKAMLPKGIMDDFEHSVLENMRTTQKTK